MHHFSSTPGAARLHRLALVPFAMSNGLSPNDLLAQIQASVEDMKTRHKNELDELRAGLDSVSLANAALKLNGPGPGSGGPSAAHVAEVHAGLAELVRTGSDTRVKATLRVGSDPEGGYLVAPVLSDRITQKIFDVSPLGRLARRETITTGDSFQEPIDPSDVGATWVGESEERPATDDPKLKGLDVPVHEIYALQKVTQRLMDDARFDVGAWLDNKHADKFARAEGAAFVNGDGIKKPRGILTYQTSTVDDGARDWFTVQYVPTGAAGAFPAASATVNPVDPLVDLTFKLRAPYRRNARWLMNQKTAGVVRKLKDTEGRYVWTDATQGMPAMLLGFPVELDEEMPDIAPDSFSIAFGDFQQAYIVVEKAGVRYLRDPFTAKPHVLMYAYRRVGGGLQNGEALKLLKFSTT